MAGLLPKSNLNNSMTEVLLTRMKVQQFESSQIFDKYPLLHNQSALDRSSHSLKHKNQQLQDSHLSDLYANVVQLTPHSNKHDTVNLKDQSPSKLRSIYSEYTFAPHINRVSQGIQRDLGHLYRWKEAVEKKVQLQREMKAKIEESLSVKNIFINQKSEEIVAHTRPKLAVEDLLLIKEKERQLKIQQLAEKIYGKAASSPSNRDGRRSCSISSSKSSAAVETNKRSNSTGPRDILNSSARSQSAQHGKPASSMKSKAVAPLSQDQPANDKPMRKIKTTLSNIYKNYAEKQHSKNPLEEAYANAFSGASSPTAEYLLNELNGTKRAQESFVACRSPTNAGEMSSKNLQTSSRKATPTARKSTPTARKSIPKIKTEETQLANSDSYCLQSEKSPKQVVKKRLVSPKHLTEVKAAYSIQETSNKKILKLDLRSIKSPNSPAQKHNTSLNLAPRRATTDFSFNTSTEKSFTASSKRGGIKPATKDRVTPESRASPKQSPANSSKNMRDSKNISQKISSRVPQPKVEVKANETISEKNRRLSTQKKITSTNIQSPKAKVNAVPATSNAAARSKTASSVKRTSLIPVNKFASPRAGDVITKSLFGKAEKTDSTNPESRRDLDASMLEHELEEFEKEERLINDNANPAETGKSIYHDIETQKKIIHYILDSKSLN